MATGGRREPLEGKAASASGGHVDLISEQINRVPDESRLGRRS